MPVRSCRMSNSRSSGVFDLGTDLVARSSPRRAEKMRGWHRGQVRHPPRSGMVHPDKRSGRLGPSGPRGRRKRDRQGQFLRGPVTYQAFPDSEVRDFLAFSALRSGTTAVSGVFPQSKLLAAMQRKPPLPTPATLPKSPAGITGLDEINGGGLPRGRPTLVSGSAGCGKTMLALSSSCAGRPSLKSRGYS
jgi:hypothetical protein